MEPNDAVAPENPNEISLPKKENRLKVGDVVIVEIGPVAHGGHFIARYEGQVIFVRHGITGEKAKVEITAVASKIVRGDAIEILEASSKRVVPPCHFSGPSGCGGCDFQHIEIGYQRELKASIIAEQFARIAKVECAPIVEGVYPESGLDWRTRMDFAISPSGALGLYASRSNDVVAIDDCLIAVEEMNIPALSARKWSGDQRVEAAVSSSGEVNISRGGRSISGPTQLHEVVGAHTFEISPQAFWQSHKSAPETLVAAAVSELDLQYGDHVCDLYGGAGLFSAEIARIVGSSGKVHLIESDKRAIASANRIFADRKNVHIHEGTVESQLPKLSRVDVILLDPPRTGAGEMVVTSILRHKPRTIVYVSCDPASMARDSKFFVDAGYQMDHIVGFDLFPMTQHVETVAKFSRQK